MVNTCGQAERYALEGFYCKVLWASIVGSCWFLTAGKIALGEVCVQRGLFGQGKEEYQGQVLREEGTLIFLLKKRHVKKPAGRGSVLSCCRPPSREGASPGKASLPEDGRLPHSRAATRWCHCAAPQRGRGRAASAGLAGAKLCWPLWGRSGDNSPPRKARNNAASPRERAGVGQPAVSAVLNGEQRDGATTFAACGVAQRWACSRGFWAASMGKRGRLLVSHII